MRRMLGSHIVLAGALWIGTLTKLLGERLVYERTAVPWKVRRIASDPYSDA